MEDTARLRVLTLLPKDLVGSLRSLSAASGVAPSAVVEMILRDFFQPEERLEFIKRHK